MLYILQELSSGYALYERKESEEIAQDLKEMQKSFLEFPRFEKIVTLKSFIPFKSAAHALENIMDISEGILNPHLKSFLEMNLPKAGKKTNLQLGVSETNLGGAIKAEMGIDCIATDTIKEISRGLRLHAHKFLKQLKDGDLDKAQLGLGHAYSRTKVKFNVNRVDNMVTQSIALLDQLDKDINTFSMRAKEWYSWHFPELAKIVTDNGMYAKLVKLIKNKNDLSESLLDEIEAITNDPLKAKHIIDSSKSSMGTDISIVDMINIERFADRVISLNEYRKSLYGYLVNKMHMIAPNVSALIGEIVGARLIAHAGSLTNLAKYPASTIQILGAEKALFRALKTKGNTPKYGLIYHSTFIGRAAAKNKGRISRILANKLSIASRIDCFLDTPTNKFGEILREQIEERLRFYEEGIAPRKNADAMSEALKSIGIDLEEQEPTLSSKKDKKKKKKTEQSAQDLKSNNDVVEKEQEKQIKNKKSKKSKTEEQESHEASSFSHKRKVVEEEPEQVVESPDKKKKKSKKSKNKD